MSRSGGSDEEVGLSEGETLGDGGDEGGVRVIWVRVLEVRVSPTEAVNCTIATSSGEEAWYVTVPSSFCTGVTLWNDAIQHEYNAKQSKGTGPTL